MFAGFKDNTQNFLWDLSFNNERPWFLEHKDEFENCLNTPFKELGKETLSLMQLEYPMAELDVHISRIYRDARRLYGRGPYKDHLWFSIKNPKSHDGAPCFFFEINPREYCFGMGLYATKAAQMEAFRRSVDVNINRFTALADEVEKIPGLIIEGPEYKKIKGEYSDSVNKWYNRKYFSAICYRDYDELLKSHDLVAHLFDNFKSLMPMYEYLNSNCKEYL